MEGRVSDCMVSVKCLRSLICRSLLSKRGFRSAVDKKKGWCLDDTKSDWSRGGSFVMPRTGFSGWSKSRVRRHRSGGEVVFL